MRLLVSGDKHLGLVSDGMERLDEQRRVLRRVTDVLNDEDPDVFVDLGDLFHTPRPTPEVYDLAFEYVLHVTEWSERRKQRRAFFIAGNHDKPTRGCFNALTPVSTVLAAHHRTQVVEGPHLHTGEEFNLLFLPFCTEWESLDGTYLSAGETIEEFSKSILLELEEEDSAPILVFSHLEVPGASMSNDETVQRDVGLSIPQCLIDSGKVLRIYAGHIHRYQELEKVTVVGSSIYVDFGEADDQKGMILSEVNQ